ncbi:major facilitator superfamily domain-containing protein [Parachaetomium inaequale]|uniref:Major facilitator superfamily domain-containing protein n=1 Tax=Parachaetomium inaequale TaxID=2588326 RepID=A0AAN6SLC3_9PEZI|nr:major facilitator superfamily domain-containing protein [Parachaetomium inaequale]
MSDDMERAATLVSSDPANQEQPPASKPLYSVFSSSEKRMMTALAGFAMLFSPLTANIYFPAMNQLETDLGASVQLINLTITSYLVLQAVASALFGDLADVVGRRPAFLAMFAVYTAANLGLALQRSFPALLTLRMVQSLGASATAAVSYGLVADLVTAGERGGVIGVTMIATNLGPTLAPLIGGAILGGSGSWQWIFWFLLVCGAFELLLLLLLLSETARSIVGNGRIRPPVWRRPLLSRRIPNPLRSPRVMFYKDSSLILLIRGVFYMIYYCLQASIALMFRQHYPQFSDTVIGACYPSIGCGVVVGGYLNGRLLNRNYAVTAEEIDHVGVDKNDNDLNRFPIERARLRSMTYLQLLHLGPMVGYGWVMQKDVVSCKIMDEALGI